MKIFYGKQMLTDLKKVLNLNTEFSRNVLTLVTGTTISQIIPIAISPILTRIYSPEDFGVLALFLSISMLIGTIASARYEQAILLPEKDEDALNLIVLSLLILIASTTVTSLIIVFFHQNIILLLNNDSISVWLYLVPIMIFLLGSFQIINVYATRLKQYKVIAKANVLKSVALALIQVGVGLIKVGASGLISGQIFSNFISSTFLIYRSLKQTSIRNFISFKQTRYLAKRYHRFPKYSVWAIMSSTLTQNVMNISVSTLFSIATLGFYSFANKIIAMPINIVGHSIGQVFYQQATKEQKETGKSIITFKAVSKRLVILSMGIFIPLFFIIEEVFAFVFSEEWRIAGQYARILMPVVMTKFIISPLSTVNNIYDKQLVSLLWQAGLLIISVIIILWGVFSNLEFDLFISYYAKTVSIYYLILFPVFLNHSRGKNWIGK